MAQLTRKRVILIEAESSYGTDPTPAATDVVLVTDLSITPQSYQLKPQRDQIKNNQTVAFHSELLYLASFYRLILCNFFEVYHSRPYLFCRLFFKPL